MSVRPTLDVDTAETYCEPEDVAEFFDKYENFNEQTDPSRQEVLRRVRAASDWVDSYTGHAWREREVRDQYISLGGRGTTSGTYYWRAGAPVDLMKRDIRTPLDADKGDKIEVWDGDQYEDWVSSSQYDEGRNEDYWVEEPTGMLYIYRRPLWFNRHKELRINFRYGKERTPALLRDVTARRAAAHFLESQQYRITTPGNESAPDAQTVAESWKEQCKDELEPYKEIRMTGGI